MEMTQRLLLRGTLEIKLHIIWTFFGSKRSAWDV